MKKILILACLFFCGNAFAEPYNAFNYVLNGIGLDPSSGLSQKQKKDIAQKALDIFTKDVGQAIAGGSSGIGGSFGIGELNLRLSLKMSYQETAKDNLIVRMSGETAIYYPILQAELGFIDRYDAIIRLSYFNDSALFGGGLRYEILRSEDEMHIPTIYVQSVYNYLVYNESNLGKFNLWNLKTGTTAYFGLVPYIQPYVFITYDITALHAVSSYYSGMSSNAYGFGYGFGGNLKLDMINISASVSMYDNQPNISFGVFVGI
ncbi:MAG: hypothetical protein FWH43_06040 [Endomicrobia bacterium]|nr:hypothetical protein [Endomicrobiia bacterium]